MALVVELQNSVGPGFCREEPEFSGVGPPEVERMGLVDLP